MFGFLTSLELGLLGAAAAFIAGVVFSQKVKDWFKGIPSDLRTTLSGVESNALSAVKAAQNKVLDDISTALSSSKPAAPATPAAPAAP